MTQDTGHLVGTFTIERYDANKQFVLDEANKTRETYVRLLIAKPDYAADYAACMEEIARQQRGYAYDVTTFNNILLNSGITLLWQLITGVSAVHFDNTNSRLVVGTGATAAAAAQTINTFTSPVYLPMDVGYPIVSAQACSWRATANTTTANQDWNEFTVTNGIAGAGTALNRAVSAQGTKTNTGIWVPTLTITLS